MIDVIIAVITAAIAITAAVVLGLYVRSLRRQILDICRQTQFINAHNSNKMVATDMRDKAVRALAGCMNEIIEEKRRIKIQAQNNERNFKDTISGISHDIRTPLTSLYGYFQMLQGSADAASKEKYVKIINGRIQELQDMTEQLFTFVKLENPSYVLECEDINLTQTLCDVMFSFYDDITRHELEPKVDIPSEIYTVNANAAALRRVLQNIIKNALVHGERELSVSMKPREEFAEICVGNPISDEEVPDVSRVFEKFYKADSSRHSGSTGLGLFIAKSLAERMGGHISAAFSDGVFTVKIWLKRAERA